MEPSWRVMLRATRISATVSPLLQGAGFRGRVVACHRSALTIERAGGLLTLASDAAGGLPDGVNLGPAFAPRDIGIREGAAITGDGMTLLLGNSLAIDLTRAAVWSPLLRPFFVDRDDLHIRAGAVAAAVTLDGRAFRGDGAGSSFHESARPRIAALWSALRDGDDRAAEIGVGLVGLGPGLTPSGDDLLVGLTATLLALNDPRAPVMAAAWADAAECGTTPIAAGFHRHAASGSFAERLHDVLRAVVTGPVSGIPASLNRAMAWGATSGADTVLGIGLGLTAVAGAREGRAAA